MDAESLGDWGCRGREERGSVMTINSLVGRRTNGALVAKLSLAAGAALCVGAGVGGVAHAASPAVGEAETFTATDEFDCDGTVIGVAETIRSQATTFFTNDDEIDRLQIHLNGTAEWSVDGEPYAVDHWTNNQIIEFENGAPVLVKNFGDQFNIHTPGDGGGVLFNDAGRAGFHPAANEYVFLAGPHDSLSMSLCEIFGS